MASARISHARADKQTWGLKCIAPRRRIPKAPNAEPPRPSVRPTMDTTKVASSREAVRPEMFSPVVFFVLVPDQKKETRKGNGKLSDCQPRGLVGLSRVEQEMF